MTAASTATASTTTVVVLGPQRLQPTLRDAIADVGDFAPSTARYAVVTAGWEEREEEHRELADHLGGTTTNLDLRGRAEDVFQRDPELLEAFLRHHRRVEQLQGFYRLRLAHVLDAARTLLARERDEDDPALLAQQREEAIEDVRGHDRRHLDRLRELHLAFRERWRPTERKELATHREELGRILADSSALCIAGGNVRILLNRLRLFQVIALLPPIPIFCWSAGAMALSERVVTFHDNPPQGVGNAEVLDVGLGVFHGLVALPHAKRRLRLGDPLRVGLFARRFGPALCAVLDEGTRVDWDGHRWTAGPGTKRLRQDGALEEIVSGGVGA